MLIGVLADTHIPKRAKTLPPKAYQYLQGVDAIIHAGDVVSESVLEDLRNIAPLVAVLGNNDRQLTLPQRVELDWEGVHLAVVHDSGQRDGRSARMRRWFPMAQVVVFGHSHIPTNEMDGGLLLFNPGSPTDRRRQLNHTMGLLRLESGKASGEILVVD
ncbi:MAG: metallophosphoesterase family protein [Chloroflexi bacterium]|nr:metallophosphoesterase family protein [Chloroflexota bacterium]